MLFRSRNNRRIVGIGLDGFPYSMACRMMGEGLMPNLQALASQGALKAINSVLPTVSGVAWASFQTGKNPAEFGVFGFVELQRDYGLRIPNYADIKCETIWERLSRRGSKFAALGIPMTWPAPKVNGLIVSGFLAPELDRRAVSKPELLKRLAETDYEIDIEPSVAINSPERFKEDLMRVSCARQKTALSLLQEDDWDLFFLHVMDTDRANHFLWKHQHEAESAERDFFVDFYRTIDEFIGQVAEIVGDDYGLLICSDHGFCELRWEFQLNRWLKSHGFLDYEKSPKKGYKAIRPGSRAVSLVPGRIHILRESAWPAGSVSDKDYEPFRSELMDMLRTVRHPETGEAVCKQVMKKEEAFRGRFIAAAPDVVIDPRDGYDLQSRLGAGQVFEKSPRSGMHTYGDAMLLVGGGLESIWSAANITDVGRLTAKHLL
jgi:predicted AlkP superfamily phosphohydrolase/phosphomutase